MSQPPPHPAGPAQPPPPPPGKQQDQQPPSGSPHMPYNWHSPAGQGAKAELVNRFPQDGQQYHQHATKPPAQFGQGTKSPPRNDALYQSRQSPAYPQAHLKPPSAAISPTSQPAYNVKPQFRTGSMFSSPQMSMHHQNQTVPGHCHDVQQNVRPALSHQNDFCRPHVPTQRAQPHQSEHIATYKPQPPPGSKPLMHQNQSLLHSTGQAFKPPYHSATAHVDPRSPLLHNVKPQTHNGVIVPSPQKSVPQQHIRPQSHNGNTTTTPQIPPRTERPTIFLEESTSYDTQFPQTDKSLPLRDQIKHYLSVRQAPRESTACITVLRQDKLFHKILLNIDMKTLLLGRRVNLCWYRIIQGSIHLNRAIWWQLMQPRVHNADQFQTDPDAIDPFVHRLREYLDLFFQYEAATETWKLLYYPTSEDNFQRLAADHPNASWKRMATIRNAPQRLRWKIGCYVKGKQFWIDLGVRDYPPQLGTVIDLVAHMRMSNVRGRF